MADKPKIVPIGANGVRVILGDDVVTLYGSDDMSHGDLVGAALNRINPKHEFIVKKPGDIVIEVPEFKASGGSTAPSVKGE